MTQAPTKNNYKSSFILDTRGYEESVDTLIEKIKATLISVGAEVTEVDNLGTKDFARITDDKFPQGIFVHFYFTSAPEVPASLQEKFRLDRTVYRILVESV